MIEGRSWRDVIERLSTGFWVGFILDACEWRMERVYAVVRGIRRNVSRASLIGLRSRLMGDSGN